MGKERSVKCKKINKDITIQKPREVIHICPHPFGSPIQKIKLRFDDLSDLFSSFRLWVLLHNVAYVAPVFNVPLQLNET